MKRQHRIFFDLLRIIHRKQILKEDLDREFNRDALYFAYVATKNKELLSIYQKRIFFDLLRIIHRKQILKEDLDREFNRDALYFAYVATKNKELLSIYQKSEKGDVKVCRAFYEMFE